MIAPGAKTAVFFDNLTDPGHVREHRLRRLADVRPTILTVGTRPWTLSAGSGAGDGTPAPLTPRESALLECLMRRRGTRCNADGPGHQDADAADETNAAIANRLGGPQ